MCDNSSLKISAGLTARKDCQPLGTVHWKIVPQWRRKTSGCVSNQENASRVGLLVEAVRAGLEGGESSTCEIRSQGLVNPK